MLKRIAVFGATGSIGRRALEIINNNPEAFSLYAVSAHQNVDLAIKQAHEYLPAVVCITGREYDRRVVDAMPSGTRVFFGAQAYEDALEESACDIALISVVGIAGLPVLLACLERGIDVALANKEALVCGGHLVADALSGSRAAIIPVDSELSALYQALNGRDMKEARRLILTASGGPFRKWTAERIAKAVAKDALKHPNWRMGAKITIDCATMINKGFEVIEVSRLFDVPKSKIDVVIHPQSIVHSMAEFRDGAVLAHMSPTDMGHAIQYALSYPQRLMSAVGYLDFTALSSLTFEAPDYGRFPLLKLAIDCADDLAACVVLNGANEAAVDLLIRKKIDVGQLVDSVRRCVDSISFTKCENIEKVYELDAKARKNVYNMFV